MTKIGETIEYQSFNQYIESEVEEMGENLDPNHSHFFLVDDGYVNKYGAEVEFRIEMVDYLRNYKNKGNVTWFFSFLVKVVSGDTPKSPVLSLNVITESYFNLFLSLKHIFSFLKRFTENV